MPPRPTVPSTRRPVLPRGLQRGLRHLAARAKPAIPAAAWPLVHALRSLTGDGPMVGLPADLDEVLVLAAHPDDEALGCAGTLALLHRRGARITIAFATDGEGTRGAALDAAEVGRLRRAEAEAACRVVGARAVFLGLPDGGLTAAAAELARSVGGLVADAAPAAIFVPWLLDGHPDHQALSTALARGGLDRADPDLEVWGYEMWTPLPANRLVDITESIDDKRACVAAHATAHLAFDIGAALGLNRWRSIHGLMGVGYAEAFLTVRARDYAALHARVTGT